MEAMRAKEVGPLAGSQCRNDTGAKAVVSTKGEARRKDRGSEAPKVKMYAWVGRS